ncbi:Uma2 family endonuclease [Armatimonas sp.]|uniref:Uma2 family endonuclease n=1 Tax=Armatimonas sp. TaxID=1872638 RepID=UPI003753BB3E
MKAAQKLSPEEYLTWERQRACRSEYRDGEVVAMAGASPPHNRIVANLVGELHQQLKGKLCDVYPSDLKTRVTAMRYTYPDVIVVCGEPVFGSEASDVLTNPTVIFEVLSPSTEANDRGEKFADYQQSASLQEYILVAQDKVSVERYTRQTSGLWLYERLARREETLTLSSVSVAITLDEIYYRVAV